jgi:hypothetical protein
VFWDDIGELLELGPDIGQVVVLSRLSERFSTATRPFAIVLPARVF